MFFKAEVSISSLDGAIVAVTFLVFLFMFSEYWKFIERKIYLLKRIEYGACLKDIFKNCSDEKLLKMIDSSVDFTTTFIDPPQFVGGRKFDQDHCREELYRREIVNKNKFITKSIYIWIAIAAYFFSIGYLWT